MHNRINDLARILEEKQADWDLAETYQTIKICVTDEEQMKIVKKLSHFTYGHLGLVMGFYENAFKAFQEFLTKNTQKIPLWQAEKIVDAHHLTARHAESLLFIAKHVPDEESYHFLRGDTFFEMKQYKKALHSFEKALEVNYCTKYAVRIAKCLRNLVGIKESASFFANVIDLENQDDDSFDENVADCYQAIGDMYDVQQEYEKAIVFYEKSADVFPDNPHLWYSMGRSYFYLGHPYNAQECFVKAQKCISKGDTQNFISKNLDALWRNSMEKQDFFNDF